MCISPIRILNPNYGAKSDLMRMTKDCESQYINVPCGVCSECTANRQMQLVQRCRNMALDHYMYFCTLTYNNESLPSITTSTGFTIKYADISDVQKMMKRLRVSNRIGREFSYFFVTERGSERGRPHVHGIFFIPKKSDDDLNYPLQLETSLRGIIFSEWRRNYGSRRNPIWRPLCTFHSKWSHGQLYTNFDLHFVHERTSSEGSDDVAFYCSKYLLKPSNKEIRLQQALRLNLSEDEYDDVWKLVKSRCLCSKRFGLSSDYEKQYVLYCLERSKNDPTGLKYYTYKGQPQPIAKYYKKLVSKDVALSSVSASGGPIYSDTRSITSKLNSIERGKTIRFKIDSRDFTEF